MATKSKPERYVLTTTNITYLKSRQGDWHVANNGNVADEFVRRIRRTISATIEQETGITPTKRLKKGIEAAVLAWFKKNCKKRGKADKIGAKDWSARDVFRAENGEEIEKEKDRLMKEDGFSGDQDIGYHQMAVTNLYKQLSPEARATCERKAIEWSNVAPPAEIQMKNAENGPKRFWAFAQDVYRQGNIRIWGIMVYRKQDGSLVKDVLDFNDRLGQGRRLDETYAAEYEACGFEHLFDRWVRPMYASESEPNLVIEARKTKTSSRLLLEKNDFGEPILPDPSRCPANEPVYLKWLQRLYRTFLCDHLSCATSGATDEIPWGRFYSHIEEWVTPEVWPLHFRTNLKDPSVMRKEDILNLLTFWYDRQQSGDVDQAFGFSKYEDRKNPGTWLPCATRVRKDANVVLDTSGRPAANNRNAEVRDKEKEKQKRKGKGKGKGKERKGQSQAKDIGNWGEGEEEEEEAQDSPTPLISKFPPRVPVSPDWRASPLKRVGTTINMGGNSPPRKRRKGKGKGKGKAIGDTSSGDEGEQKAFPEPGTSQQHAASSSNQAAGSSSASSSSSGDDTSSTPAPKNSKNAPEKRSGGKGKKKLVSGRDTSGDDEASSSDSERTQTPPKPRQTSDDDAESSSDAEPAQAQAKRGRHVPSIPVPLRTRSMAQRETVQTRSKGLPIEAPAPKKKPQPKPKGKKSGNSNKEDIFDMAERRKTRGLRK